MRGVAQVAHSNSSSNSSKGETMIMTQLILVKRAPKVHDKSKIKHSISKSRNSNNNSRFVKCTTISQALSSLAFTPRRMRMITSNIAGLTTSPSSRPTKLARKIEVSNRTTTTTTIRATATTTKAITTTMDVVAETITDSSRSKETSNNPRIAKVRQSKYKSRRKGLRHPKSMKHSRSSLSNSMRNLI